MADLAALRAMAISNDDSLAGDARLAPGAALTRQLAYAKHVARYDVVVRTPPGGHPTGRVAGRSLRIHPVPASRAGFIAGGYSAALAVALRAGTQLVSCQDPLTLGLVGYLLKRRLGIGLNLQINGDIVDSPYWLGERRLHRAFNRLARWLIPRADTLRVSTTGERAKFVTRWGIAEERVWNVPFMVDFGPFLRADPSGARDRLGVPPDAPLVLFVGRLVKQKDLGVLLRAVRRLLRDQPRAVLAIVGSGPEEQPLRGLATELGIGESVRFAGRIPHAELPAVYAAADVFALSSHYEGTSMVTLEAAAAALPIVSTDLTSARDAILGGESGLIVPLRDPAAFGDALARLLDDPARARRMGECGRAHVLARFDSRRIARHMAELWYATARLAGRAE